MRVIMFATRLAGTDGVSLESNKLRAVLERRGHEVHYCAGELDEGRSHGHLVPEMRFTDPAAEALSLRAFRIADNNGLLEEEIFSRADSLLRKLRSIMDEVRPDLITVQNAWSIPMHLPLAVALARLVDEWHGPHLAHNHDYWWERSRFAENCVADLLNTYFPYVRSRGVHLSINSEAQRQLQKRRGIRSMLLPNVLDFAATPPSIDDYNRDFRRELTIAEGRPLFVLPARVIPRKGIELAIDLCARLSDLNPILAVTRAAGDEGLDYLEDLKIYAEQQRVDFRYIADRVADVRHFNESGRKVFSQSDVYLHADFVTYPSLYEGFGNVLLEAVWFRRPVLVNRYSVYVDDIAPKGFKFVEVEGRISDVVVTEVRKLLQNASDLKQVTDHNFAIAKQHYSFEAMEAVLSEALQSIGLSL